jgi:hypothetical protein
MNSFDYKISNFIYKIRSGAIHNNSFEWFSLSSFHYYNELITMSMI